MNRAPSQAAPISSILPMSSDFPPSRKDAVGLNQTRSCLPFNEQAKGT